MDALQRERGVVKSTHHFVYYNVSSLRLLGFTRITRITSFITGVTRERSSGFESNALRPDINGIKITAPVCRQHTLR